MISLSVIDPSDVEAWPADVRAEVEALATRCGDCAENTSMTVAYELSLGRPDAGHHAEQRFRCLIGERRIALAHATRLLPHERETLNVEGLQVLAEDHRSRRLDAVIARYGTDLGVDRLEGLRHAGPLAWNEAHRLGRLGLLWGVTPLKDAFDRAGDGMTVFLENWGGESFYWAGEDSSDLRDVVADLTERSAPLVVRFGARATSLNTHTYLWPIFVGQIAGWPEAWHEFYVRESVAPAHIAAVIDEASDAWPLGAS